MAAPDGPGSHTTWLPETVIGSSAATLPELARMSSDVANRAVSSASSSAGTCPQRGLRRSAMARANAVTRSGCLSRCTVPLVKGHREWLTGLALVRKHGDIWPPRIPERCDKQVHLDPLTGDRHRDFTEIDLQLLAGSRFEAHSSHLRCAQFPPEWRHRALHRAQRHRDAVLALQVLAHHIRIAAMPL